MSIFYSDKLVYICKIPMDRKAFCLSTNLNDLKYHFSNLLKKELIISSFLLFYKMD